MAQIAETQTAQILAFPHRSQPLRPVPTIEDAVASARRVLQPHNLDLSRAVPADDDAVERLRQQTRAVIAARSQAERAELVSALLLQLENNPLARCLTYPSRDVGGHPFVQVVVAGIPFRLQPDDCRTAASALISEQAFPGCVGVAGDLREAAAMAEARNHGASAPLAAPASPPHRGRTGMAATLGLALVILCAAVLSAWSGH